MFRARVTTAPFAECRDPRCPVRGGHTHEHATGAYPNGTRVVKVREDPSGDLHPIGARATVIGSLGPVNVFGEEFGYCLLWDDTPGIAIFTRGSKIAEVTGD